MGLVRSESSIRAFGGLFNRAEAARGQRPRSLKRTARAQLPSCVFVEGGLGTGVCEGSEFAENPFKL